MVPDLKRVPSDYLRDNMLMTTSGNYLPAAFKCSREALGMDKILLGTDYPYEEMAECMRFLEGWLSEEASSTGTRGWKRAALIFGNAARDWGID